MPSGLLAVDSRGPSSTPQSCGFLSFPVPVLTRGAGCPWPVCAVTERVGPILVPTPGVKWARNAGALLCQMRSRQGCWGRLGTLLPTHLPGQGADPQSQSPAVDYDGVSTFFVSSRNQTRRLTASPLEDMTPWANAWLLFQARHGPRPAPGKVGSLGASDSAFLTRLETERPLIPRHGFGQETSCSEPQVPRVQNGDVTAFTNTLCRAVTGAKEINAVSPAKSRHSRSTYHHGHHL